MNILIINHYAGSPMHGMEYRHYYLARNFVRNGHRVDIVAASYSHLRISAPETKGRVTQEVIDGIRYWWLRTCSYHGNGAWRVANMLQFSAMLMALKNRFVAECAPDLIIASSPHPFIIFGAAMISRDSKAKLVFEVRDLWPLTLIELGNLSPAHPFVRLMQLTEDYAYRRADRVVSLLPGAMSYMMDRGMKAEKILYVPNGIDSEEWDRRSGSFEAQNKIRKLKGTGSFLVGYAGAHGIANELYTLIEAAELLRECSIRFVLVGDGPEKKRIETHAKRLGLDNVEFLPPIPRSAMPAFLAEMDALYIGLKKEQLFRFGISPNKLMDYMMSGRPVIQAISAGNDMVAESGCGLSIPPEDPKEVAGAIRALMALSCTEREAMGRKGNEYVKSRHDYRILAGNIMEAVS